MIALDEYERQQARALAVDYACDAMTRAAMMLAADSSDNAYGDGHCHFDFILDEVAEHAAVEMVCAFICWASTLPRETKP